MPNILSDRPCILIIDDELHIRTILCELIAADYRCETASSAEEGIRILREHHIALVISDINMDGISGLEMVPQILATSADTVVISEASY
jgi:two-component system response regulator FlrC